MSCCYCDGCIMSNRCMFSYDYTDTCKCDDIIRYARNKEKINSIENYVMDKMYVLLEMGYEEIYNNLKKNFDYIKEDYGEEEYCLSMLIKIIEAEYFEKKIPLSIDELIDKWKQVEEDNNGKIPTELLEIIL